MTNDQKMAGHGEWASGSLAHLYRQWLARRAEESRSYMCYIHTKEIIPPHMYDLRVAKLYAFFFSADGVSLNGSTGSSTPDFPAECFPAHPCRRAWFSPVLISFGMPLQILLTPWYLGEQVDFRSCCGAEGVKPLLAPAWDYEMGGGSRFLLCWTADKKMRFENPGEKWKKWKGVYCIINTLLQKQRNHWSFH